MLTVINFCKISLQSEGECPSFLGTTDLTLAEMFINKNYYQSGNLSPNSEQYEGKRYTAY